MIYSSSIYIACPYCSHLHNLSSRTLEEVFHAQNGKPFVVVCDLEEGGCDKEFVARITLSQKVSCYEISREPSILDICVDEEGNNA
jgi:hypothetical protein